MPCERNDCSKGFFTNTTAESNRNPRRLFSYRNSIILNIEILSKLHADLGDLAAVLEAEPFVKGRARIVARCDDRHDRVRALVRSRLTQDEIHHRSRNTAPSVIR